MNITKEAHRGYFSHTLQALKFMLYQTYFVNTSVYSDIWEGCKAVFTLIFFILMTILSPVLCWVIGIIRLKNYRTTFEFYNGTYVGKLAHLNNYKDMDSQT